MFSNVSNDLNPFCVLAPFRRHAANAGRVTRFHINRALVCPASGVTRLAPLSEGQHRPDTIRQRDVNFQFSKQIKPAVNG